MPKTESSKTVCLKSPLSEKAERLQPLRELVLQPYYGAKKRLRLVRTSYSIGTAKDCDIVIEDPAVSPLHARLSLLPGGEGYLVEDLASTNGTFLNGIRIKCAPLPAQGTLRLGRSTLSWSVAETEITDGSEHGWIFADPFMKQMVAQLRKVANSSLPVLLLGETGTGKEIFARLLHQWSHRAGGPYVAVNGALTGGTLAESELFGHKKGAFTGAETARLGALRAANSGTLFLDEVADIPASAQVKLLRALEAGEVKALGADEPERADFRLVTATSQDLEARISDGRFRLDLYFRVAGFTLVIPPLRDRPEDILAIARKHLADRGLELDRDAEGKLLSYRWPGNVRELRSSLERAVVVARGERAARVLEHHFLGMDSGGMAAAKKTDRYPTLMEAELNCIKSALERNGWSRSIAAKELGIARSTLFEKMRRYRLRDGAMIER